MEQAPASSTPEINPERKRLLDLPGRKEFFDRAFDNLTSIYHEQDIPAEVQVAVHDHFVNTVHITMLYKGETVESTPELRLTAELVAKERIRTYVSGQKPEDINFMKPYVDTQDLTEVLHQAAEGEELELIDNTSVRDKIKRHLARLAW